MALVLTLTWFSLVDQGKGGGLMRRSEFRGKVLLRSNSFSYRYLCVVFKVVVNTATGTECRLLRGERSVEGTRRG